jgi:hypothetical protein
LFFAVPALSTLANTLMRPNVLSGPGTDVPNGCFGQVELEGVPCADDTRRAKT